ncbi:helicase associated domain-containing protein [Streptomyces sp. NPDC087843]|uniref:helicase associated domain-containing protein n=1 Tax=Streptomyces sp. NPDC087843 TaxID=3365804 RepID=UPI00381E79E2
MVPDPGGTSGASAVLVGSRTGNGSRPRRRKPAVWLALTDRQRERLEQLHIVPFTPVPEPKTSAKTSLPAVSAFDRGVAALAQYKAHTGSVNVSRAHVERLKDRTEVKLGVWIMNQKTRRTKLTPDKRGTLAALGLNWATA